MITRILLFCFWATAIQSLSVKLENISGIVDGDTISGTVIDCDTGDVLATDRTEKTVFYKLNINHKLNLPDGTVIPMPNTPTTTVYLPKGSVYYPNKLKGLNGYDYVGNSIAGDSLTLTYFINDIDFYYAPSGPMTKTDLSDDGKSFNIQLYNTDNNSIAVLALYNENDLCNVQSFQTNIKQTTLTTTQTYTHAKVMLWNSIYKMQPLCRPEYIFLE